jgi:serine/threonine-protein kinase
MSVSPGSRFGSHEIVAILGAGGMGEVYRARDTNLKREVALKVLPPAFLEDRDRLARFQREAEILASLNHPNIAQVYGLEKADGQTAIVMELVEGPTLADRIQQGAIPADEAMAIALQVVAALEAAHDKGIVHRDLKPANVKVREDGTVKVLDFGISKPIDPKLISGGTPVATTPAMTQTGIILGTAAYMSPEQARGRFVDERTDIWAFGCLLFEMLTGQPAFGGEDMMAVLARVIDRDTDLSSIPKAIAPAVRHTIRLCLQKDPRRRIADIRDVRLALEGRFESELPGSVATAAVAPLRQRALVHSGALAAGAALMALIGLALWPDPPSPPVVERWVVELSEDLSAPVQHPIIAVSSAGDIAYSDDGALYYRPVGELEARRLDATAGHVPSHLALSPDGTTIVYWSEVREEIYQVATGGGTPVRIAAAPVLPAVPSVTADGSVVYSQGPLVMRVPLTGSEDPEILFDDSADSRIRSVSPQLLNDGRTLLMSRDNEEVVAVSLDSGEVTPLFAGAQPSFVPPGYIVYIDGRNLYARVFDPTTLQFGDPVELVDSVFSLRGTQLSGVQYGASAGALIYVPDFRGSAESGNRLAIVEADGEVVNVLPVEAMPYAWPRVSPDPDNPRVAVVVASTGGGPADTSQILLYELSGRTELRPLTLELAFNGQPAWKDAQTLYFSSNRDGRRRIYEQLVDGGAAIAVTEPEEGFAHAYPVATPDGRLAYTEQGPDGTIRLWVQSADDSREPLLASSRNAMAVDFSSDGGAMVYMEIVARPGEQQPVRILTEPFPSSASGTPTLISVPGQTAVWPAWSRSGPGSPLRLFYQGDIRQVMSVDIIVPGYLATSRRPVFALNAAMQVGDRAYDVIPGSDRLLVVVPADTAAAETEAASRAAEIVVIGHIAEELKARVPPID